MPINLALCLAWLMDICMSSLVAVTTSLLSIAKGLEQPKAMNMKEMKSQTRIAPSPAFKKSATFMFMVVSFMRMGSCLPSPSWTYHVVFGRISRPSGSVCFRLGLHLMNGCHRHPLVLTSPSWEVIYVWPVIHGLQSELHGTI